MQQQTHENEVGELALKSIIITESKVRILDQLLLPRKNEIFNKRSL